MDQWQPWPSQQRHAWQQAENWAEIKEKPGVAKWKNGGMGCFLAGKGLIDGGSVDVDFSDCAFYPSYTRTSNPAYLSVV
jgi:hypothetical protein